MMTPHDENAGGAPQSAFFTLEESDRQMLLLGLARLSVERPGWLYATSLVAEKLSGLKMFEEFRRCAGPPPGFPRDVGNTFEVRRQGDMIIIGNLDPMHGRHVLTLQEAMELHVWVGVLADPVGEESARLRKEVQK